MIKMVKKMKKKNIWIFKSTKQMIISIILFILFIMGFIYISTIDFSKDLITDSEKFANEYKNIIDKNNIFSYVNNQQALLHVKSDNVIILFGIKNSEWVGYYANILNEVAMANGIEKIYYYDITNDREKKNATYQSITNYLSDYITHLDDGTSDLHCPTLLVKKDGIVRYFDDSNAFISGNISVENYWSDYNKGLLSSTLDAVFKDYMEK